jgi:hypothetical protein
MTDKIVICKQVKVEGTNCLSIVPIMEITQEDFDFFKQKKAVKHG